MFDNEAVAILGASGQVGSEFVSLLKDDTNLIMPSSKQLNLAEVDQIYSWLNKNQPTIIINAAAFTDVDGAENKRQEALALNAQLPSALASWCECNHARLLHFSSDYVFSGGEANIQNETVTPYPLNWYGKTKAMGDKFILDGNANALILRSSWIYSEHHKNFLLSIIRQAQQKKKIFVVDDQIGTPTPANWLAKVGIYFLNKWHKPTNKVINAVPNGFVSWYDFATSVTSYLNVKGFPMQIERVVPISSETLCQTARRPKNSKLDNRYLSQHLDYEVDNWDSLMHDVVNKFLSNISTIKSL